MARRARLSNLVLFGQRLDQNLAKGPTSSIYSRANSTDGDSEFGRDRLVVHLLDRAQDQDRALIRGYSGKSLVQDAPQVLSFQEMHRIVAISLFDALETCLYLVLATTSLAPCQVKAAKGHRPG